MKIGIKKKNNKKSGHILLPMFGAFYAYTVFLPCCLFLAALVEHAKGADLIPTLNWWQTLLAVAIGFFPFVIVFGIVTIFLGIFVPASEADAENAGLGFSQIFRGKNWKERICRELTRLGLFLGAGAIALPIALLLPTLPLQYHGFFAFWQLLVLGLFYFVILPLKCKWPRLGGFEGDPEARYVHHF